MAANNQMVSSHALSAAMTHTSDQRFTGRKGNGGLDGCVAI